MNKFYVYQLRLETESLPFYVGKGQGTRAKDHMQANNLDKSHKANKIRKAQRNGIQILIEYLKTELSEDDAFMWEVFWIAEYGRLDLGLGPLTNKTDGGEGESGRVYSEESKRKIGDGQKRHIATNGHAKGMLGKNHSEESRAKMSEARIGKPNGIEYTDEVREKIASKRRGKIACFDKETLQNIQVPREEFEALKGVRYVGVNSKEAKSLRLGLAVNNSHSLGSLFDLLDAL